MNVFRIAGTSAALVVVRPTAGNRSPARELNIRPGLPYERLSAASTLIAVANQAGLLDKNGHLLHLGRLTGRGHVDLTIGDVDAHRVAFYDLADQKGFRQPVFDLSADHALERTGAVERVEALFRQAVQCRF